ncbi:MAG: AI-2E family transporter [Patescibacteria group bacterium]
MANFEISWESLWRVLFMMVFAVALFLIKDVLMILFLALVISSALDAPVNFLERRKIPRILGALIIFIFALAVLALLLYIVVPIAFDELRSVLKLFLPQIKIESLFKSLDYNQLINNFESSFKNLANILVSGGVSFIDAVLAVFGGIAFASAAAVISFYMAASRNGVERFLIAVLPADAEEYVLRIYLRAKHKLGLWAKGQLVLSFVVGLLVFLGLQILGVKYSLILGILAGIFEIVPFVGPVIIGILAFLIAVAESWGIGFAVMALFLAIQQLENHLLIPLVMKRTVGLHPIFVIFAMLAGAQIAGFIGVILAVPTAVIIQEIIEDRAAKKKRQTEIEF